MGICSFLWFVREVVLSLLQGQSSSRNSHPILRQTILILRLCFAFKQIWLSVSENAWQLNFLCALKSRPHHTEGCSRAICKTLMRNTWSTYAHVLNIHSVFVSTAGSYEHVSVFSWPDVSEVLSTAPEAERCVELPFGVHVEVYQRHSLFLSKHPTSLCFLSLLSLGNTLEWKLAPSFCNNRSSPLIFASRNQSVAKTPPLLFVYLICFSSSVSGSSG